MSELADFLRARRERLTPAEVGLPDSGRRRTPGLRREEVATLAGVSIDYLVRLEQGRDTHPSAAVLAALADALRLTEDERMHLSMLGLREGNRELCPVLTTAPVDVRPTVRTLLERLGPTPAFVVGPYGDVLAWNDTWAAVVGPLGVLDGPVPNLARFTFQHPGAPTAYPDWEREADAQVSHLRTAGRRWSLDEGFVRLVEELQAVPAFATRWAAHEVEEKRRGEKRLAHPTAGPLRVAFEVLLLPDEGDQRLVTWLPADARTEAALVAFSGAALPVSPARLRVVGDH